MSDLVLKKDYNLNNYCNENALNNLSNFIEDLAKQYDFDFIVYGGYVYKEYRCLKLDCSIPDNLKTNPKGADFITKVCEIFNLEKAGFDVKDDCFWLWKFR